MARYVDVDKYLKGTFCDKFDDCTSEEECFECWAKRNTEDVVPIKQILGELDLAIGDQVGGTITLQGNGSYRIDCGDTIIEHDGVVGTTRFCKG